MGFFNVTIPPKDSLCYVVCEIKKSENDQYSTYFRVRLNCRKLLETTPQAMAVPTDNGGLYVIVTKEFLENDTFWENCNTLDIQIINLRYLLPNDIYEKCLLYTIEYRLAPHWNKVESYLVEGQDFLSSSGSVNAIKLKINDIRDNSAQFCVTAVNLKIPFLRLSNQRATTSSVYVLPKTTWATVLSQSEEIAENQSENHFRDYEDLRAYWKNMHGYILPEHEEGLLYYIVEFYSGSSILLYPETCLISNGICWSVMDIDPKIYNRFREGLMKIVLCGQQLDVRTE
ncbi:hypothetical protein ALC60_04959 [Trachymyrmex zeteki]|uniref:DUF4708 domain-containing protein n=1 Tax=Mycetomoellerius zeteki TaxID=64791 RepID=A0A151X6V5_9HYME|nr:PREDICTED: uncharacterized protein C18orf63-like [Trachymyrmex zeteki]XP_018302492.1 PREDICTED: uncharacterized protein C18orf63-like [Trachymyrmex zeteki]XP_018302493.1 PREDICTED: uncharacterized protein C18orf63-like [Trachymyrmex zeteki]KYQ56121.1 hypothetical protein ALC60_04959 [Trachymyrmex zeteki]